jgi:hypothetical protein
MAISTANQAIETPPSASPASVFVPADEMEATEHFEPLYGLDPLATKEEAIHAMRESLGGNLKQVASKPKSKIADTGHTPMMRMRPPWNLMRARRKRKV